MESLASKFKRFALWTISIEIALIAIACFVFYLLKSEESSLRSVEAVTTVSPQITEEIAFQAMSNNRVALELLVYELVERYNVEESRFYQPETIQSSSFLVKFGRCWKGADNILICKGKKGKQITSFVPIEFDGQTLGYLSLAKRLTSNNQYFGQLFILFVTLIGIVLLLNILFIGLVYQRIFKREFSRLMGVFNSSDPTSNEAHFSTKEFEEIKNTFTRSVEKLKTAEEENRNLAILKEKNRLSQQVAHDIRSPLSALDVVSSSQEDVPENTRRILKAAVKRIKDIANNLSLSGKMRPAGDGLTRELMTNLVDELISEKRTEYRNANGLILESNINSENYGLFADINPIEFRRVLSNLLNNAIESLPETKGMVLIEIEPEGEEIVISVIDNGRGLPVDVADSISNQPFSYGKEGVDGSGTGLGLKHAKECMGSWKGSISLSSREGIGTTVTLRLPSKEAPVWFAKELVLRPNMQIAVIDDDESIHQIWNQRCSDAHVTLSNSTDPRSLLKANKEFDLYLVDYEFLGHELNGLDLIRELGIQEKAILVTSHFENIQIRELAQELNLRTIPKNLAGFVPISRLQQ